MEGQGQLFYDSLSLGVSFFLVFFYGSPQDVNNLISHVVEQDEFPTSFLVTIIILEWSKTLLMMINYPRGQGGGGGGGGGSGGGGRRLGGEIKGTKKTVTLWSRVLELWRIIWQYLVCCGLIHVILVLFGAPVLSHFKATLEFSIILASWIALPLLLISKDVFGDMLYLRVWNYTFPTKLRYFGGIAGVMVGTVVIPLDWDRLWQRWPLPCLFSAFGTILLVNIILVLCSLYGAFSSGTRSILVQFQRGNKVKSI